MLGQIMISCISGLALAIAAAVAGAPYGVCFGIYSVGGAVTLLVLSAIGNPLRNR
ncbi:MAG: hypothetical protein KGN33_12840 [Paracoccaceae bacterium]|nr:hypothetical protein [Paracoccaceae bacterium]